MDVTWTRANIKGKNSLHLKNIKTSYSQSLFLVKLITLFLFLFNFPIIIVYLIVFMLLLFFQPITVCIFVGIVVCGG